MSRRSVAVGRIGVLGTIAFIALLGAWFVHHSNFMVGRALLLAFPEWDVEYRGAIPHFTGRVVAARVVMIPPWGERADAVSFDRVTVDVPAWQWYRSAFSGLLRSASKTVRLARGDRQDAIRNVAIVLENGRGIGGIGYSRELALVGLFSASPFEAEGCMEDSHWTRDELGQLGLASGPTRVTIELNDLGDQREHIQRIDTPGVGRAEYRGTVLTPDGAGVFAREGSIRDAMAADSWHFVDAGFVAARNRYCARVGGIDEAEFVRHHLLAVERTMGLLGVAPEQPLRAAYASFAAEGGDFAYDVTYAPPIGLDLLEDEELTRWLPRLRGGSIRGGERTGPGLVAVPAQPMPEGDWETTFDVLVHEGVIERPQRTVVAARQERTPASVITRLATQPAAVVEAPQPLTHTQTLARSGDLVRLYTTNARPRVVEVLPSEDGALQVRWRVAGGAYEYQVAADRFVRAEALR
jgi:hypothetical protein